MHKPNLQSPSVAQRPDEIFDVVDAEDRVIRQATRKEVHAEQLWHRATHVLVFNAAGKVFLQKRSMSKDSSPGRWDSSCSGHLDTGEDYRTAAVRELFEEIGISAKPDELQHRLRLSPSVDTGWEFVFIFTLLSDATPIVNPAEIEQGAWFEPSEVTRAVAERPQDFTPSFRLHWPESKAFIGAEGRD